MKFSIRIALVLRASLWLVGSLVLLKKGIGYLMMIRGALFIALLISSLLLGMIKGLFVLRKRALVAGRALCSERDSVTLGRIFASGEILLILLMVFVSWLLRTCSFPKLGLGVIDTAVGFALFIGSLSYFGLRPVNIVKESSTRDLELR